MVKMSETLVSATHRIFQGQMNEHGSLFGGQTVSWLDEVASIAAHRYARRPMVTGSLDRMVYVAPVLLGHALTYHSVVTGHSQRTIEVFTKIIGEDLDSGNQYLAAWSLMTFVVEKGKALPELEADLPFAAKLSESYAARAAANKAARTAMPNIPLDHD